MATFRPFEWDEGTGERYDQVSITLGEWYDLGFYRPLDDDSWRFDAYDDEQYTRWCAKFLDRYYYRDVGVLPAARWKREYLRRLNEVMPKYKPLYERMAQGINPLQEWDDYEKRRDVFSDFPATLLTGNADYASTANDTEHETVREGNIADQLDRYMSLYNDADVMLLDEMEPLFSSLMTASIPLF